MSETPGDDAVEGGHATEPPSQVQVEETWDRRRQSLPKPYPGFQFPEPGSKEDYDYKIWAFHRTFSGFAPHYLPPSAYRLQPLDTELQELLEGVRYSLMNSVHDEIFAIGGKISRCPVTLRWGRGAWDQGRSLTLPLDQGGESSEQAFAALVRECQPAGFGRGTEDVFDEEYRKAGKLTDKKFCTSFNPYEHGVIDLIKQALVRVSDKDKNMNGIRAELYSLNIYSAPSGKFRPHVDTPRSESQMGSLVVSLPCNFQGGQLAVRHYTHEMVFDWADEKETDTIQWAAFFSDCEHEVMEVTEGHRITLAYNLFWVESNPITMSHELDGLDRDSLPFFKKLQTFVKNPRFRHDRQLVGFTCAHAYPHTSELLASDIQCTLKGIDMVIFQALKRLTSNVAVRAAVDMRAYEESVRRRVKHEGLTPWPEHGKDVSRAVLTMVSNKERLYEYYDDTYFGALHPHNFGNWDPREPSVWEAYEESTVTWLNHAPDADTHREKCIAHVTYGNEAGIGYQYSSAVIIACFEPLTESSEQAG